MGLTAGGPGGTAPGEATWDLIGELQALARGRLCRGAQRDKCRTEQGPFADWACGACTEYLRPESISPWTWHLLLLHRLRKAGYPFRANDLSLETWLLLATVEEALTKDKGERHGQRRK